METRAERNVIPEPHDVSPGTLHMQGECTPHHVFWGCTWVAVLSCVPTLPETSPELAAVPLPRSETKHLVTSCATVGGQEAALKNMWQVQSFLAKGGQISLQEARHSQGEKLGL